MNPEIGLEQLATIDAQQETPKEIEKVGENLPETENPEKYLHQGEKASMTQQELEFLKEAIVDNITGEGKEWVENAAHWVQNNLDYKGEDAITDSFNNSWHTLPREQLLAFLNAPHTTKEFFEQGFVVDCESRADTLAVLCRLKNIPTRVAFAVEESNAHAPLNQHGTVHFFIESYIGNNWVVFDPMREEETVTSSEENYRKMGYVLATQAIDSWEMGIKTLKDQNLVVNKVRASLIN